MRELTTEELRQIIGGKSWIQEQCIKLKLCSAGSNKLK